MSTANPPRQDEEVVLSLDAYQQASMHRSAMAWHLEKKLAHGGMGIAGEAGEVADLLKKSLYYEHQLDTAKLMLELGDVLWYVAYLADAIAVPLSQIAQANLDKLAQRYPQGFSPQASQQRTDVVEGAS